MEGMVKLNIGGYKYSTTRQTLCGNGENFFSSLFSGRIPAIRDDKGCYFIDRDGKYFAPILEFLRTSELRIPSTLPSSSVYREAEFYSVNIPPIEPSIPWDLPTIQVRTDGVYFNRDCNFSYCFGPEGKGIYNVFNNFSIAFSYTSNDSLIYISLDGNQNQKMKKTLLYSQGSLIDANFQHEILEFSAAGDIREWAVYEGILDISKDGNSRSLTGFVFGKNRDVTFLNIGEEETQALKMWKKGTIKTTKFMHLNSFVISIPLDSLSIEIIPFASFLVARIRRTNNLYFVYFTDIAESMADRPDTPKIELEETSISELERKKIKKKEDARKVRKPVTRKFI